MKTGVWIKLTENQFPNINNEVLLTGEGKIFLATLKEINITISKEGQKKIFCFHTSTGEETIQTPTHFMLIPELKKG